MTQQPVRIPSDVDREDRILANLTARQLTILAITGIVLYGAWTLTREVVPLPVFLILAVPIGTAAAVLVLGRRDGMSLDRLLLAAIRQRLQPRHQVAAPEGVRTAPDWLTSHITTSDPTGTADGWQVSPAALRLPAEGVTDAGVIDLGTDGVAMVAVASTVNFALRTPGEQEALVASFGRYLHSISAPVQILIRAERLDLSRQIRDLHQAAPGLPHPRLEAAAREHATYLDQLRRSTDLLRRQVLIVLREPVRPAGPTDGLGGASPLAVLRARRGRTRAGQVTDAARRSAETRLVRRLGEAVELLAPAGITVTPLDAGQATAVLATACNPDSLIPPTAGLAGADEVITTAADPDDEPPAPHRTTADQREPGSTAPAMAALDEWEGGDL
ncbi:MULTISPECIES: PrgI family protein [Amycolatopsis]|uniref:PrgI family protein n=1 Tax=Amycolatopsis saalfeldensis TaxID=394193 RepID=A0A1H8YR05_9PSEU|nr:MULTISPECIES: PrgI family protein [Amycolatopsis]SEP54523.1 PrgI family protein [Amycolatopsis saalfeldensis]